MKTYVVVLNRSASVRHMFSWRNKKNISTFVVGGGGCSALSGTMYGCMFRQRIDVDTYHAMSEFSRLLTAAILVFLVNSRDTSSKVCP